MHQITVRAPKGAFSPHGQRQRGLLKKTAGAYTFWGGTSARGKKNARVGSLGGQCAAAEDGEPQGDQLGPNRLDEALGTESKPAKLRKRAISGDGIRK